MRKATAKQAGKRDQVMTCAEVLARLKAFADPRVKSQMAHFGVHAKIAYGVTTPNLRAVARQAGKSHTLAAQLWTSGIHEARILAGFVGEPAKVTAAQMERWARDFDTWDIVDGTCCHLFAFAAPAWAKAIAWSRREEEFIKRAAFALMAYLALHDKQAPDSQFLRLLPIIRRHSADQRNFVRKAVNWALRQIGKRNLALNKAAIRAAQQIRLLDSSTARWIAADALRELHGPAVQRRLRAKKKGK